LQQQHQTSRRNYGIRPTKESGKKKAAADEAALLATRAEATTEDGLDALMANFGFEEGDDCSGEKGETKKSGGGSKKKKKKEFDLPRHEAAVVRDGDEYSSKELLGRM
jgi:hypothetical protein